LIVIVIAAGAVSIDFAFGSLLIDQAKLAVTRTADQVERTAEADATYAFGDTSVVLAISDRATLDHFASSDRFVQIDSLDGQVLGKSSNLGGYAFPPVVGLAGERWSVLHHVGEPPASVLLLTRVLTAGGRPLAIAYLGVRLDLVDALVARVRTILLAVTIAAILAILVASYLIAGMAIDPIQRLTAAVTEIGSDRLDLRLRWKRADELGRLAAAFDAMLDRLQSAFARERQFISDASHELRTPLTVINANAQLLRRWGDRDEQVRSESIDAIAEESSRLAGMVSGMLTLAKAESGDAIPKEPLVLERLVDEVVERARDRAAAKQLALEAHHPNRASTIVVGDAGLLRQLVGNLVDNAIKFTREGRVDVTVRRDGEQAIVEVADTGAGIESSTADRLFDRFFRGDPAHARTVEGTGLGLAIVRSIARIHGGAVAAEPRPGGGSVFSVTIPAEPESLTGAS
jgi:signal transduction histidine kinase